jgi:hypothetical protein
MIKDRDFGNTSGEVAWPILLFDWKNLGKLSKTSVKIIMFLIQIRVMNFMNRVLSTSRFAISLYLILIVLLLLLLLLPPSAGWHYKIFLSHLLHSTDIIISLEDTNVSVLFHADERSELPIVIYPEL